MTLTPPKVKEPADPRHKAFLDYAFESYRDKTSQTLVITGREVKTVSAMLKATRKHTEEFSLENLERFWVYFMEHGSVFEKSDPLYWYCRKLNHWQAGANNGNGTKKSALDHQRDWLKGKLGK